MWTNRQKVVLGLLCVIGLCGFVANKYRTTQSKPQRSAQGDSGEGVLISRSLDVRHASTRAAGGEAMDASLSKAPPSALGSLHPGDMMDVEWNSRSVAVDFSDRAAVGKVLRGIAVQRDAAVTEEQLDAVFESLTEVVFDNGSNSFDSCVAFLKASGERLDATIYKVFRQTLTESGKIAKEDVAVDPWQVLSQYYHVLECSSRWKGLVSEGSKLTVYKTRTAAIKKPGEDLASIRGAITTFRHFTNPARTLNDGLRDEGEVLIAEATVFVAHEDRMGGIVRPYVIRYWHDSASNMWRPLAMTALQNRHDHFDVDIMY